MGLASRILHCKQFPPEVVHGFTTRNGGVSTGRYASLNLGEKWGDDSSHVEQNLQSVASEAGFDAASLIRVKQVHGATVVHSMDVDEHTEADAIWMDRAPNTATSVLGVMTADCVPVLFSSGCGRYVAAAHSGWRSTVGGICRNVVEELVRQGVRADAIFASVGPSIGPEHFEVGDEVARKFPERFVVRALGQKPHVDLRGVVTEQLERVGVKREHIEQVAGDTFGEPDQFFSYRRDGAGIGQHLSFIGFTNAKSRELC